MAGGIAALLGKNRGSKPSLEIAIGPSRKSPRGRESLMGDDEDDDEDMGDTEAHVRMTDYVKALVDALGIDVKSVDIEGAKAAISAIIQEC